MDGVKRVTDLYICYGVVAVLNATCYDGVDG